MIYTHQTCPWGRAARAYLDQRGVAYQVRDVERDSAARAEFRQLGGIGTPLLLLGTHVIHGFDPLELEMLLKAEERRQGLG